MSASINRSAPCTPRQRSHVTPELADPARAAAKITDNCCTCCLLPERWGLSSAPTMHSQHFARRAPPLPRHFYRGQRKFSNVRKDLHTDVQEGKSGNQKCTPHRVINHSQRLFTHGKLHLSNHGSHTQIMGISAPVVFPSALKLPCITFFQRTIFLSWSDQLLKIQTFQKYPITSVYKPASLFMVRPKSLCKFYRGTQDGLGYPL